MLSLNVKKMLMYIFALGVLHFTGKGDISTSWFPLRNELSFLSSGPTFQYDERSRGAGEEIQVYSTQISSEDTHLLMRGSQSTLGCRHFHKVNQL